MSDCLFYAKTSEGWMIKMISDHLKTCLKTNGEFRINEHGIILRQASENKHLLTQIDLKRDDGGFDGGYEYNYTSKDEFFGMNLINLQQTFKNIKKKDAVEMMITKDNNTKLVFILHSIGGKKETCSINIYSINKKIEKSISGYAHPMIIPSTDFQKMIKKLSSMDAKVTIKIQGSNYASFFADDKSLCDSCTEFGTFIPDKSFYEESFYTNDLKNTVKMPAMSKVIALSSPIHARFPIKISTKAGSLGSVETYIKDVNFIEAEKIHESKK